MASGSILHPPLSEPVGPGTLPNGLSSPMADDVTREASEPPRPPRSESDLSDTQADALHDPPSNDPHPDASEPHLNGIAAADAMEDDDQDAEGEEDDDFIIEYPPDPDAPAEPVGADASRRSSMSHSSTPSKRKASLDDDDYIRDNPELYGLRRSHRAKQIRTIVDSSDEEEVRPQRKRSRNNTAPRSSARPTPQPSAPDSDGSDSDDYGGSRNAPSKKKRRLVHKAIENLQPEIRFSTRAASKVTNYAEDDNDDEFEEDSENMTPNYWAYGPEEEVRAIDAVLKHEILEDRGEWFDLNKEDFKYLIKWQGEAHYHAEWKTYEDLKNEGITSLKKLDNYWRKILSIELYTLNDPEISVEDREAMLLEKEKEADTFEENRQIERVIGHSTTTEGPQYYVKWKGLLYDCCTWEDESLVSELAQNEIDRFLERSSKLPVSNKTESKLATRSPFQRFRMQPQYIQNGELREFQVTGLNFLAGHWCKGDNVILADEMGLGKTVQTVSFLNWLRHDRRQQGPFLIVVPLSTMPSWADTFNYWTPDLNYVVYYGKQTALQIIRDWELCVDGNPKKPKFHALLTTYEKINSDDGFLSSIPWQFLAVDEAHRLKSRDSQLYQKLMNFNIPSKMLITGTPLQNTLGELSALMDFLMPGQYLVEEDIDLQSDTAAQKIDELNNAIRPFLLRRTKATVENDLPPKTERIIRVDLADVQLEYYKNVLTRNYTALNQGAKGPRQSLLNIMMELKKASNHPFLFPVAEERILSEDATRAERLRAIVTSSGKMMLLDQMLTRFKKEGHRVLIFSQMVNMLNIMAEYMLLRGHQYQRLDGTIAAATRRKAIDHFNEEGSEDYCFLLSTRAGGLGINLMTADTVILFDSDWNPQADLQAMARAHRIGQKKPVTVYRFVSKNTIEEEILERARNKLMLEYITIQRGVTGEATKKLSQKFGLDEPTSADDISRILKKRGQKMFEASSNQKDLEEMDIETVLANAEEHKTEQIETIAADVGEEFLKSFEYTDVKVDLEWDDIIPKDQLDKIKEEERRREEERLTQELLQQNEPRKRKAANQATDQEREQRAAKKRARVAAIRAAAESNSNDDDDSEEEKKKDPKRPLDEKETRNLIQAYQRYGAFEDREEDIIKDARLVGRDKEVLKAALDDVISLAKQKLKEYQDSVEAKERENNKTLTKKDKKAVLFDYHGVKRVNADTILDRPTEMRMCREVVNATPDFRNFRIPEASKPTAYDCPWGAREDGMLVVGIARYGFGAWVPIRDDAELGMKDKFFLEEHRVNRKEERSKADEKSAKKPGAVHLVRRADYLLSVLKDKTSNGTNIAARRALENHHRNNRKGLGAGEKHGKRGDTPNSHAMRRGDSSEKHRHREHGERRSKDGRRDTPDAHRRHSKEHDGHRPRLENGTKHNRLDRNGRPDDRPRSSSNHLQPHRRESETVTHRSPLGQGSPRDHEKANGVSQAPAKAPLVDINSLTKTEQEIYKYLEPVMPQLESMKKCKAKHFTSKQDWLATLSGHMKIAGDRIKSLRRKDIGPGETSYWQFVADHFWVKIDGKPIAAEKLSGMWYKLKEQEKQKAAGVGQSSPPPPRSAPAPSSVARPSA